MFKIEVFQEDVQVKSRVIAPKDGKPARTFYEQTAYAYLGGKFPVQLTLQVPSPAEVYLAGEYTLDSTNFVVNNFGGLELKRFGQTLTKLPKQTSSDAIQTK